MGEHGQGPQVSELLPIEERSLVTVYGLMRARRPDRTYSPGALQAAREDNITAIKEGGMANAHSAVYQPYYDGDFWFREGENRQTPEEVAASGLVYHHHPAARARVQVEIEEARSVRTLQPGFLKLMISPEMAEEDASCDVAKAEHLAGADMARLHRLDITEDGTVRGKYMNNVMLPPIPLPAWHAALNGLGALIGKRFDHLESNQSALPVMRLHSELEFPTEVLPEGLVTVIEHVLPHVSNYIRSELENKLLVLRDTEAQIRLHQKAESLAERQLQFDMWLADSLLDGVAVSEITMFINQMSHVWDDDALSVIRSHFRFDGGFFMTKELAIILMHAQRILLLTRAGVATGDKKVLDQIDANTITRLYTEEAYIDIAWRNGASAQEIAAMQARSNRIIAQHNVQVGAGCAGQASGKFRSKSQSESVNDLADSLLTDYEREQKAIEEQDEADKAGDSSTWKWTKGVCRVEACYTRPGKTQVGPCAVCRHCQRLFDQGIDPTKRFVSKPRPVKTLESTTLMDFLKIVAQANAQPITRQASVDQAQPHLALSS